MPAATTKNITMTLPVEGSQFRPARDTSDIRAGWKHQVKNRDAAHDQAQAIANLTRMVEKLRRRILGTVAQDPKDGMYYMGEYDPSRTYTQQNLTEVSQGDNAGVYVYIYTVPTAGNNPWDGAPYWAQFPSGTFSVW